MRLTLASSLGGVIRRYEVMLERLQDLKPVLREAGKSIREESKKRFAEQRFAPLAASTLERLQHISKVTSRGTIRKSYYKKLRIALGQQARAGKASFTARQELDRLFHGGGLDENLEQPTAERQASRALQRLRRGLQRHQERRAAGKSLRPKVRDKTKVEEGHRILGRLVSSLGATVDPENVTVASRVGWAGIHNRGGTAGHGAQIPKRTFLELTRQIVEAFVQSLGRFIVGGEVE